MLAAFGCGLALAVNDLRLPPSLAAAIGATMMGAMRQLR